MENNNQYLDPNINLKVVWQIILWMIFGVISFTGLMIAFCAIASLFEGDEEGTAAFIFALLIGLGFLYPAYRAIKKLYVISTAKRCAKVLNTWKYPFISITELQSQVDVLESEKYKNIYSNSAETSTEDFSKIVTDKISNAIKFGYLKNCTLEFHNGNPVVAMHKKVVKDKCPYCGAPIVYADYSIYTCQYCGSKIDNVLEKK